MSVDLHATSSIEAVKQYHVRRDGPPYFSIEHKEASEDAIATNTNILRQQDVCFPIAPLPFVHLIHCYENTLFSNVRPCFKKAFTKL